MWFGGFTAFYRDSNNLFLSYIRWRQKCGLAALKPFIEILIIILRNFSCGRKSFLEVLQPFIGILIVFLRNFSCVRKSFLGVLKPFIGILKIILRILEGSGIISGSRIGNTKI